MLHTNRKEFKKKSMEMGGQGAWGGGGAEIPNEQAK